MPGYLTHSEPRFFLFFLECAAQGDEQLTAVLGVCFLGDLSAQIPDSSVVYSGSTWDCSSPGFHYFTR
jgi:hypothetical protein